MLLLVLVGLGDSAEAEEGQAAGEQGDEAEAGDFKVTQGLGAEAAAAAASWQRPGTGPGGPHRCAAGVSCMPVSALYYSGYLSCADLLVKQWPILCYI